MSLICDMFKVSIRLVSFKSTNLSIAAITLRTRYVYINVFLCIKPSPASKSVWPSLDIIPCSTTTNETVCLRAWMIFGLLLSYPSNCSGSYSLNESW